MSFQDFSDCLSAFDPAVHLHSELIDVVPVRASYSDDIEALNVTKEEQRAEHIKNRTVIQHRAWTLPEIFRSEDSCVSGGYACRHEANSILTIGRQPNTNQDDSKSLQFEKKSQCRIRPYSIFASFSNNAIHFVARRVSCNFFASCRRIAKKEEKARRCRGAKPFETCTG